MERARIAISGSSGLVGSALIQSLGGARVLRLTRAAAEEDAVLWNPQAGAFDASGIEGCDAVVHLAGEPIAAGRWSAAVKARIRDSRIDGTRLLVDGLRKLPVRPRVLVSASAIGIYGDRAEEELTEESAPGDDFLADVARGWEEAAARATDAGIRVVSLRFGVILARDGGALPRMLTPFRFGLGGRLGGGRQWMSWIHIHDVVGVVRRALEGSELTGPVNTVAPEPVRNAEFTRVLARAVRRPAIFPAPAFALRLALGEMADALLLSSQRVLPERLGSIGYAFRFPSLEPALTDLVVQ